MKTIIIARHSAGPHENGTDYCHARAYNQGMCPGVKLAAWLNGLGEDNEFYIKPSKVNPHGVTNVEVRRNWLRGDPHILCANEELVILKAELVQAKRNVTALAKRIRAVENSK